MDQWWTFGFRLVRKVKFFNIVKYILWLYFTTSKKSLLYPFSFYTLAQNHELSLFVQYNIDLMPFLFVIFPPNKYNIESN